MKKSMLFKKMLLGVLSGVMVLSLSTSISGKSKNVTLEWQQWWAVECPKGYVQKIVDTYYKKTGVKINLLSAPFADTKTQIVSGASTGTVADIVSVDSSWV